MRRLGVSALAFVGLAALLVGVAVYERTFHPRYVATRQRDREAY